jgi:tetratricopeptide (TPR) repeat protein
MKKCFLVSVYMLFCSLLFAQNKQEQIKLNAATKPQTLVTIEDFNKAIAENPQNTDLYISRVRLKGMANDFKGAINDFSKAIELYPNATAAYFDRAKCKVKIKDFEGAIFDFSKTIEIDEKNYIAYYERANLFFDTKKYKEAVYDYT